MDATLEFLPAEPDGANSADSARSDDEKDALHILPLSIIPLETASLKRARLLKDARLESAIELYNDKTAGSGRIDIEHLGQVFDWPADEIHPDLAIMRGLCGLHSYDVFSLRIELRRLNLPVSDHAALRLSDEKNRELTKYMAEFTRPLIQQIYGNTDTKINDVRDLIGMFSSPDKGEALRNLRVMADRLEVKMEDVPAFLEDYGDIFMSLAYFRDTLDEIVPLITEFGDSLSELRKNYQLRQDRNFMVVSEKIGQSFNDITSSITGRFESFDNQSRGLWDNITAESFRKVKAFITSHHTTIAGVLCGLKVKMNAWNQRFSDGRGGPIQRSDFIMSDIRQGIDLIMKIERDAPKVSLE